MCLSIGCGENDKLFGYADADFAECRESRKSHSGFILMLGGPISWACRRQSCVALSSTEAEYVSLTEACKEVIWLQRLLVDFKWKHEECVEVFEDNQNVLSNIRREGMNSRTKHVDTKKRFIEDCVKRGVIKCTYCPTKDMVADILTKGLPRDKFEELRNKCGLAQHVEHH